MADRLWTWIAIGGDIPEDKIPELAGRLDYEGFDDGNVSIPKDAAGWEALLSGSEGSTVECSANEVAWGTFEELEAFCSENGIAFLRRTDPKYKYSGEYVWRNVPGVEDGECSCDAEGYETLEVDHLKALLKILEIARKPEEAALHTNEKDCLVSDFVKEVLKTGKVPKKYLDPIKYLQDKLASNTAPTVPPIRIV